MIAHEIVPIGLALIDVHDDIVPISLALIVYKRSGLDQGCNARKVISEVYTSFVLQCTVSGQ